MAALEEYMSVNVALDREDILLKANALFHAAQSEDLRRIVDEKIENLRHFDVLGMERVVAICGVGAYSGSILLTSYFDGHEDIMMLPEVYDTYIYQFFELCQALPLRDKLLGYPFYHHHLHFFDGDFAIFPTQYYAAVQAILESSAEWPADFLESRRAFFLFVHIAYHLALGRRLSNPRPLIVYALHYRNDVLARRLAEDFPRAKFIHTIRDPIMLFDRLFSRWSRHFEQRLAGQPVGDENALRPVAKNPSFAAARWSLNPFRTFAAIVSRKRFALRCPIDRDRPHLGMESRTLGIRFEDMHCHTEEAMRNLTDWLGLSFQVALLDSTFNGIPWVVTRDGQTWSGARPAQAERNPRFVSRKDQALLFALLYENFLAWKYPYPKLFRSLIVRCAVFVALILLPMKIEFVVARTAFKNKVLPSLKRGRFLMLIRFVALTVSYRLTIIALFALEFFGRCIFGKTLLEINHQKGTHETDSLTELRGQRDLKEV